MKVSIIIPAHNEENNIEKIIKDINGILKNIKNEIIVVNDCSTDKTAEILKKIKLKNLKVVNRAPPNGFGRAIRSGFEAASGDIIITVMADFSDDPNDILKLIKKIEEGYDVVCGSRFINDSYVDGYPFIKLLANRIYNRIFGLMFFSNIKDISNGFKAYRKEVIKKTSPKSDNFEITSEVVLKAIIEGYKIGEVPVSWFGRKSGRSKFIFLPKSGWQYGKLASKLWFKFLLKKLTSI